MSSNPRKQVLKPFIDQADSMNDRVKNGIEQHRKGWFTLKVTDAQGAPVPGARITLTQKTHEFKLGANLFALSEMKTPEQSAEFKRLFAGLFNLATLPFYWQFLEPEEGKPRYAADSPWIYRRPPIDMCLDFCEEYGVEPKAHCLDYDIFTPDWVPREVPAMRRALYKRFSELAARYADRIPGWEVTNENTFLPSARNTPNFRTADNMEWDFRTADALFPLNRLIINEAAPNIWPVFNGNRSGYYMQIERLLREGCRVDSIGMQFHMVFPEEEELKQTPIYYSPEHLYAVMDCYAALGRPLQITELTVPAYRQTDADEDIQAEILKNLYSMWFSHPAMEAIICWDTVDGYEWTPYPAGMLRHDLTPKPSYRLLRELFHKTWRTNEETGTNDEGRAAVKGFYGQYEVTIHAGGKTVTRTVNCSRQGAKEFALTI